MVELDLETLELAGEMAIESGNERFSDNGNPTSSSSSSDHEETVNPTESAADNDLLSMNLLKINNDEERKETENTKKTPKIIELN